MSKNLAKYYQENKERLQKKARERYQNVSKEEKEKKRQYGREHYKNLSEDEKKYKMKKTPFYNYKKTFFKKIMLKNMTMF